MSTPANELLQAFQKQKVIRESEVLQAAQRLVNQFRSLRFFNESFIDEYNKQLLAAPPDVRRFFSSLMGGNEVAAYFEFLEKQIPHAHQENEEGNHPDISAGSYLPMPEEDLSVNSMSSDSISISKKEWEEMQTQQKFLTEQIQRLSKQLNISQEGSRSDRSFSRQYSEIIDEDNQGS